MAKKNDDSPTLTDVKGIGPARAKQLKKVGIHSPKQLAQYNPETVAKKTKLSESRAKRLVEAAEKAAGKSTSKKKSSSKKKAGKKSSKKDTKKSASKKTDNKPAKAAKAASDAMKDIIARARDHFKQAPNEHHFHLHSGDKLKDLRELAEAFEDMQEHVFKHHVNDSRHDFANWVSEVLDEHALAEQLREARKHPQHHSHVIYRHITRRVW